MIYSRSLRSSFGENLKLHFYSFQLNSLATGWLVLVCSLVSIGGVAQTVNKTRLGSEGAVSPLPPRAFVRPMDPELEERVVDLFVENRCDQIALLVAPLDIDAFRPSVQAVIAFCNAAHSDSEKIFQRAETLEPSSDTIYFLHARYRWKINKESSFPLFQRVLLLARNPGLKKLAEEYLDDDINDDSVSGVGQGTSFFATLQLGMSHENNPQFSPLSQNGALSSYATNLAAAFTFQKPREFGSLGVNYTLINNHYNVDRTLDLLANNIDTPVAIRVGSNEDIVLRPFGTFITLGYAPYQMLYGFGILGLTFREHYKQSVQGSFFQDSFSSSSLQPQSGTHFRFEYNWEFFYPTSYRKYFFSIEHVAASQDSLPDDNAIIPSSQTLSYSHTDISLEFAFESNFRNLVLGFAPKFLLREDSDPSTYASIDSGKSTSTRREEIQVILTPSLIIPLTSQFQIYGWYELNRTFSNLGPNDYQDKNILNQTIGIALRTFVSNF